MTTAAQATAAGLETRIGDIVLQLCPLTDRDIAELDLWLQRRIVRIGQLGLQDGMTEDERGEVLRAAIAVASSTVFVSNTGARLMSTVDGWARIAWQSCRQNHPDVTDEQIRAELRKPGALEELRVTFDTLNLDGQRTKKKSWWRRRRRRRRSKGQDG